MTRSVVIVGGSLSGLMNGVHLKRQGVSLTTLEQNRASERSSHNAGIQSNANFISVRKRENLIKADKGTTRYWASWGHLYRIFRANFDGYVSKACPTPRVPKTGDSPAEYLTGKRVTSLEYASGTVTLNYVDVETGEEYPWLCRLERHRPAEISVPGDIRVLQRPSLLRYQGTITQGSVDPHTWDRFRGPLVACMPAPFAELVSATTNPFVTKVSDVLCSKASFCDGHVVLVGDALAIYRRKPLTGACQSVARLEFVGKSGRRGVCQRQEDISVEQINGRVWTRDVVILP
ncbi:hypothetical protein Daus18300_010815 [Diaporthe australafricana]|uniref:Uncharacterized protein n=1 Tax=Diaporthe australafricana TaxID=127596 RepID=A0ABR3W8X3_9PEZI